MSGADGMTDEMGAGGWERLGRVPLEALGPSLMHMHWAAQPLSWFGEAYAPHRADYGQRALTWDRGPGVSTARMISAASDDGIRLGVTFASSRYQILDPSGTVAAEKALAGSTLAELTKWIGTSAGRVGLDPGRFVPLSTGKVPPAAVADGAPFGGGDTEGLAELARCFGNADAALEDVRGRYPAAGPVWTWPHHFDMATLLTVLEDPDPERTRSVGVGLSPGDVSYAAPYFYVTPWPYPDPADLPDLPVGSWHREPWVGAVLQGSDILEAGDAVAQADRVARFLDAAVPACVALVRDG